jgi:hypothetical protein
MALQLNAGSAIQVAANAATLPTVWTEVGYLTEYDISRSLENVEEEYFFSNPDPELSGGDKTSEYSFNGGTDWSDAGQNMIRAAYESQALLWCRVLTDETAGIGQAQKIRITGYNFSGQRNGSRYARSGFNATGAGAVTQIVGT